MGGDKRRTSIVVRKGEESGGTDTTAADKKSPKGARLHREHERFWTVVVCDIPEGEINIGLVLPMRLVLRDGHIETNVSFINNRV